MHFFFLSDNGFDPWNFQNICVCEFRLEFRHLGIWPSGNSLPKKPDPSMRVWVRSPGSSKYMCV
jgi:hypothetical protein